MSRQPDDVSAQCHALNNLFTKILWTTEFALEQGSPVSVKAELEAIRRLAQDGGGLVESLRAVASRN